MTYTLWKDDDVIKAIRSNKRKAVSSAFQHIYRNSFPAIKCYVIKRGGTDNDAADIFQESAIILFDQVKLGKFRGESSLNTYLNGIARNIWFKSFASKPRLIMDLSSTDDFDWPNIHLDPPVKKCLKKIIQELPGNCGEILLDFYFRGLSMAAIRDKYGLGSTQAAKNKKLRCMKRLITQLSKQGITADHFVTKI